MITTLAYIIRSFPGTRNCFYNIIIIIFSFGADRHYYSRKRVYNYKARTISSEDNRAKGVQFSV